MQRDSWQAGGSGLQQVRQQQALVTQLQHQLHDQNANVAQILQQLAGVELFLQQLTQLHHQLQHH